MENIEESILESGYGEYIIVGIYGWHGNHRQIPSMTLCCAQYIIRRFNFLCDIDVTSFKKKGEEGPQMVLR